MNKIIEALELVGQKAFEAGVNGKSVRPGELVQITVREAGLGGFDPLKRTWLKERATEQLQAGRNLKNGK